MEFNRLKEEGFLDPDKIYFTTPGLHEIPRELENQLVHRMGESPRLSWRLHYLRGWKQI